MVKSRTKRKPEIQIPASIVGLLATWAITIILLCIGAIFIESEYIEMNYSGVISVFIVFLSAMLGCLVTRAVDQKNLVSNLLVTSGSYILSLIIGGLLFFDGLTACVLIDILAVLTGALVAFFAGNKGKIGLVKKRRRTASR